MASQGRTRPTRGRYGRLGPDGIPSTAYGRSTANRTGSSGAGRRSNAGVRSSRASSEPPRSAVARALALLSGGSGARAKRASSRVAAPAGIALAAGVAGLAFKHWDKLMHIAGRGSHDRRATSGGALATGTPRHPDYHRSLPGSLSQSMGTPAPSQPRPGEAPDGRAD